MFWHPMTSRFVLKSVKERERERERERTNDRKLENRSGSHRKKEIWKKLHNR